MAEFQPFVNCWWTDGQLYLFILPCQGLTPVVTLPCTYKLCPVIPASCQFPDGIMVEPSTWWLRAKSSEKDENATLPTDFAKSNNVRHGIHENNVLKCISGYTFSNNQLLQVEIAFNGVVTVWPCDQVGYGCGLPQMTVDILSFGQIPQEEEKRKRLWQINQTSSLSQGKIENCNVKYDNFNCCEI